MNDHGTHERYEQGQVQEVPQGKEPFVDGKRGGVTNGNEMRGHLALKLTDLLSPLAPRERLVSSAVSLRKTHVAHELAGETARLASNSHSMKKRR